MRPGPGLSGESRRFYTGDIQTSGHRKKPVPSGARGLLFSGSYEPAAMEKNPAAFNRLPSHPVRSLWAPTEVLLVDLREIDGIRCSVGLWLVPE